MVRSVRQPPTIYDMTSLSVRLFRVLQLKGSGTRIITDKRTGKILTKTAKILLHEARTHTRGGKNDPSKTYCKYKYKDNAILPNHTHSLSISLRLATRGVFEKRKRLVTVFPIPFVSRTSPFFLRFLRSCHLLTFGKQRN